MQEKGKIQIEELNFGLADKVKKRQENSVLKENSTQIKYIFSNHRLLYNYLILRMPVWANFKLVCQSL